MVYALGLWSLVNHPWPMTMLSGNLMVRDMPLMIKAKLRCWYTNAVASKLSSGKHIWTTDTRANIFWVSLFLFYPLFYRQTVPLMTPDSVPYPGWVVVGLSRS